MPVKQSASKEDFLKSLKLDSKDSEDSWKLQQMWEEVVTYWVQNFETTSRHILKPEYASNSQVQRPYKWGHLNPEVINSAIADIWKNGRQWPRHYYDMGATKDEKVYNWVLKWLLWHVCRYRDWRNRKNRQSSHQQASSAQQANSGSSSAPTLDSVALPPHDFWATVMN